MKTATLEPPTGPLQNAMSQSSVPVSPSSGPSSAASFPSCSLQTATTATPPTRELRPTTSLVLAHSVELSFSARTWIKTMTCTLSMSSLETAQVIALLVALRSPLRCVSCKKPPSTTILLVSGTWYPMRHEKSFFSSSFTS